MDPNQKEILINTIAFPEWLACWLPEDKELLAKVADRIYADFNHMQAFFKIMDRDAWHEDSREKRPLIKALIEKFLLYQSNLGRIFIRPRDYNISSCIINDLRK